MKNTWIISLVAAACLGLAGSGCGDNGPKVTWKETTGTVVSSVDRGDGTCISEIKYDAGKGPTTTTYMGGKVLQKGQTLKMKYDEAEPGSVKLIDKPE